MMILRSHGVYGFGRVPRLRRPPAIAAVWTKRAAGDGCSSRRRTSQLGGLQTYKSRLGKDRSAHQSRRSIASAK